MSRREPPDRSAGGAPGCARSRSSCPDRARLARVTPGQRGPRTLPRVRSASGGWGASVPARAVAGAGGPRPGDRREPPVRRHPGLRLQLVQLRFRPPAPLLARGLPDGASRRRPDRRVPGLRRRHRRKDRGDKPRARRCNRVPVALQPREAPRARDRSPRAGRDLECGRPDGLPPPGGARAARRPEGPCSSR